MLIGFALISDHGDIYYLKVIPPFFHHEIISYMIQYLVQLPQTPNLIKFYGTLEDPSIPILKDSGFVMEHQQEFGAITAVRMLKRKQQTNDLLSITI